MAPNNMNSNLLKKVVNLLRPQVVSFNRPALVSLNRPQVVNFTGACKLSNKLADRTG